MGLRRPPDRRAIALLRLDPATRAEVNAILAADPRPVHPTRACPAAGLPLLVASADWADARRNGATAPDHYVDLPLALDPLGSARGEAQYDRACANHCVSWAIRRYAGVLATSGSAAVRGKALRYVVHFVGDVHQPLHAVGDEGGGTTLEFNLAGSRRETTLHAAWDSGILAGLQGGLSTTAYAAQINRQLGSAVEAELEQEAERDNNSPEAWAWQSHGLAVHFAYGPLPSAGGELDPAYLAGAERVIPLQLERAGQRLARLLAGELDNDGALSPVARPAHGRRAGADADALRSGRHRAPR